MYFMHYIHELLDDRFINKITLTVHTNGKCRGQRPESLI